MRARSSVCYIFIFILGFLLCFPALGVCANLNKPSCAVLTLHPDVKSTEKYESRYITNRYAALLELLDVYDVLSPDKVTERLKDSKWQMIGTCSKKECALEAGRIIGVDYIIYGVLGHIGKLYSMDTTLLDVKAGRIVNRATTDFEGSRDDFANEAPPKNIRELMGLSKNPPEWNKLLAENAPKNTAASEAPAPKAETAMKNIAIGPRIGIVYNNNNIEAGAGIEAKKDNISLKILGNNKGIATALSYHLAPAGNTPYASLVATWYKDDPHGIDERGWIYGALVGYRMYLTEKLDVCIGLGPSFIRYHQTEPNRSGKKDRGTKFRMISEFSIGFLF